MEPPCRSQRPLPAPREACNVRCEVQRDFVLHGSRVGQGVCESTVIACLVVVARMPYQWLFNNAGDLVIFDRDPNHRRHARVIERSDDEGRLGWNFSLCWVVNPLGSCRGCGRSVRRRRVSADLFRRRADECRRLATAARNASDKKFWLGLVERWQALANQNGWQRGRGNFRSPTRGQSELSGRLTISQERTDDFARKDPVAGAPPGLGPSLG